MKHIINKLIETLIGSLIVLCVFGGLILMMCECEDLHTQYITLFGGLALMMIGLVPGAVISAWGCKKQNG